MIESHAEILHHPSSYRIPARSLARSMSESQRQRRRKRRQGACASDGDASGGDIPRADAVGLMNAARALQSAENFVVAAAATSLYLWGKCDGNEERRRKAGRKEAFEEETREAGGGRTR